MEPGHSESGAKPPFSEKSFYLAEFRGRTLAIAAPAEELLSPAALEAVLKELEANATRVVLISNAPPQPSAGLATPVVPAASGRLEGAVWREFAASPRVGVCADPGADFAAAASAVALRLGISKLIWIDRDGGLLQPDGTRDSFLDLEQLRERERGGFPGESPQRRAILGETQRALEAGLPAVNLCTLEGLAAELFTYSGAGTLFTRERYITVRRLGLDDFDAAHDLALRGVAEGYLAPRPPQQVEQILAGCPARSSQAQRRAAG